MQEIRACHQLRPIAMRLAPLDHWLALKAFFKSERLASSRYGQWRARRDMDVTYTPPVTSERDPARRLVLSKVSGALLSSPYQVQVRAFGGVGARSLLIHGDDLPPLAELVLAASFHSAVERGTRGSCIV